MKLEPVTYWKLKSELLFLSLQESQLLNQKAALLAEHGLLPVPYVFKDETLELLGPNEETNASI